MRFNIKDIHLKSRWVSFNTFDFEIHEFTLQGCGLVFVDTLKSASFSSWLSKHRYQTLVIRDQARTGNQKRDRLGLSQRLR
jgi:hypothetical protein